MLMQKFQVFGKKSFSFLETEFGFKCHLLADGILRYETEDVFVLVGYDGRRSYELTLDLGQKEHQQNEHLILGKSYEARKLLKI